MKKIVVIIALMGATSYAADSFIRRTQTGDGYTLFWGNLAVVPVGTYADLYGYDLMYKGHDKFIKNYVTRWDQFKKNLLLYQKLENQLNSIMQDPIYKHLRDAINEIETKANAQVNQMAEVTTRNTRYEALVNEANEKHRMYNKINEQAVRKSKTFAQFKKAWDQYKTECLNDPETQEKLSHLKSIDEDLGTLSELDYLMSPPEDLLRIWKEKSLYLCQQQRRKCLRLYFSALSSSKNNPQIIAAYNEIKKTEAMLNKERDIFLTHQLMLTKALERELGIEQLMMQLKQFVESKMKELKIQEQLQEIRKLVPPHLIKLQERFDVLINQIINQTENAIQIILDERKARQTNGAPK